MTHQDRFKIGHELATTATLDGWVADSEAAKTARNHLAQAFGILCLCATDPAAARQILGAAISANQVTGLDLVDEVAEAITGIWPELKGAPPRHTPLPPT